MQPFHPLAACVRPRALLRPIGLLGLTAVAWLVAPDPAFADHRAFCSGTAYTQFVACRKDVSDDLLSAKAICLNLSDPDDRSECYDESSQEFGENRALCWEQLQARLDLCDDVGEARYDPEIDPAAYDDDFASPMQPNPWYPIATGYRWDYEGGEETIHVEVSDATKEIEGVPCVVVRDTVREDGKIKEDTDDWIALRLDGNVEYFGEIARNFETFEGDDPEDPELVDIEGSFKVGRDGAKQGTLFLTGPQVGDVYREEYAQGEAEDAARILSTTYSYGEDPELDEFVPEDLANHLCHHDCAVTLNFTPLEPDALERKYYAPGIGVFLEVDLESGDTTRLVGCNVDAVLCGALPMP